MSTALLNRVYDILTLDGFTMQAYRITLGCAGLYMYMKGSDIALVVKVRVGRHGNLSIFLEATHPADALGQRAML